MMHKAWQMFPHKSIILFLSISVTQIFPNFNQVSYAQRPINQKSVEKLDLKILNQTQPPSGVFTSKTINQNGLTAPSLWWIKDNFEKKLMDNWIAYSQDKRVDVIVNQQLWSILDDLERYNFINRVGVNARNFGYNTRIFNYQEEILGTYTCNLPNENENTQNVSLSKSSNQVSCKITMNAQDLLGIQPVNR